MSSSAGVIRCVVCIVLLKSIMSFLEIFKYHFYVSVHWGDGDNSMLTCKIATKLDNLEGIV